MALKPGGRRAAVRYIDAEIGRRIREARVAKRITQTELGLGMGVTFQQIQKYEMGINSVAICRLPSLCKTLALDIKVFVTDIDVKKSKAGR